MRGDLTFTGVLLAGGQSARMGWDKGARWGESQCRTLQLCGLQQLMVSAPVPPPWCPGEARWVPDARPGCGPLSGLAAALDQLSTTHAIVVAVDLPQMTADYLRQLRHGCRQGLGVVPRQGVHYQPLAAIYPREAAAAAMAQLQTPHHALQRLCDDLVMAGRLAPIMVEPTEEGYFANLNTPESLT